MVRPLAPAAAACKGSPLKVQTLPAQATEGPTVAAAAAAAAAKAPRNRAPLSPGCQTLSS